MKFESKSARRDRREKEWAEECERNRQQEAIRRREHPTLQERVEDIEEVLRDKFNVTLNGY